MSSGAGHIFDMINRLKDNRALRTFNRAKFKGSDRKGFFSGDAKIHSNRKSQAESDASWQRKKMVLERKARHAIIRQILMYVLMAAAGLLVVLALVK